MKLYPLLQMDPCVIKPMISSAKTSGERRFLWFALAFRSALIVAFAIVFISFFSAVFGSENNPLIIGTFCILLGTRFVDFGYRLADAVGALAICFALFLVMPQLVPNIPPAMLLPAHFAAFFTMIFLTSQKPVMGNAGLYAFAYIYSIGNPVSDQAMMSHVLMAFTGFAICCAVYVKKHHGKNKGITALSVAKSFSLSKHDDAWMLRMAAGTSIALSIGSWFGVERFIWLAFPCAAILSTYPYSRFEKDKGIQRVIGAVAGSLAFLALYVVLPANARIILAPLGGFALGLSADYRFKTAFNCFGALFLANGLYGIGESVTLRIVETIAGTLLGLGLMAAFHVTADKAFFNRPNRTKATRAAAVASEG